MTLQRKRSWRYDGRMWARAVLIAAPILAWSGLISAQKTAALPVGLEVRAGAVRVPGIDLPVARAEGIIYAPMTKVVKVLEDYPNYPRFIPYLTTSKVLARRGPQAILYTEISVLDGKVKFWVQTKVGPKTPNMIEGSRIKGNVRQALARWYYWPVHNGAATLVAFELAVDPDWPLGNDFVVSETLKMARDTIDRLRAEVRTRR